MKPSERIKQILQENWPMMGVDAVAQYLDEQYELHKEDIQITQGR